MNMPTTRQFIEAAGVLGVIFSLLFVGMQLQLDRDIAIGEQYHNRAEQRLENLRNALNNEYIVSARVKNLEAGIPPYFPGEEIDKYVSEELIAKRGYTNWEIVSVFHSAQIDIVQIDNIAFQYTKGLMPPESWEIYRAGALMLLSTPIHKAVATSAPFPLADITREMIAELDFE